MFWNLLLAHITGDFLLQTDWMVKNRGRFWVLTLHSSTHFVLMLLLVGKTRNEIWYLIALIALIHMAQDAMKYFLVRKKPKWSRPAFVIDQTLHCLILWIVSSRLQMGLGLNNLVQTPTWVIVAIGYLIVTYVWFFSERTFNQSNLEYINQLTRTKYSRMVTRAGLISIFLLVRNWTLPGLAMVLPNTATSSKYRQRALLIDLAVSIVVMVFLSWALGLPH